MYISIYSISFCALPTYRKGFTQVLLTECKIISYIIANAEYWATCLRKTKHIYRMLYLQQSVALRMVRCTTGPSGSGEYIIYGDFSTRLWSESMRFHMHNRIYILYRLALVRVVYKCNNRYYLADIEFEFEFEWYNMER